MNDIWNKIFLGNTATDWLLTFLIIAASWIAVRIFKVVIVKRIYRFSQKTASAIDDFLVSAIQKLVIPFLYILAFYFGLQYLTISANVQKIMYVTLTAISTYMVVRMLTSLAGFLFKSYTNHQPEHEIKNKQAKGILLIINVIIWLAGLIFLIDNLGYNITTIVAGLGIGGIAIALAAQTILGDLFSYLVIFFDKPFEIGDFIIIDDKMGTIEYIGIKTTRIRTLGGEQLICSNTDLTNSRVHNYKRMERRRVVFSFGVVYQTEASKLKEIPLMVKNIIQSKQDTQFDRAHFLTFGDFSLNFEVVYYVLSSDYNVYVDRQQAINLDIFTLFQENGTDFAYPTQTVLLNNNTPAHVRTAVT